MSLWMFGFFGAMAAAGAPVAPVAPAGTNVQSGLHDIKPPVEIPSPWPWIWAGIAIIVLALAGWFAWKHWRRRSEEKSAVPPVPAHIRARQQLEAALALIGRPREFCILVSDTARSYLEERFQFHAPDRTTEEFLYELRGTSLLLPDQKDSLGEFLKSCDLVKFARYEPGEPELRELHASALRLVEETEPIETPASTGVTSAQPAEPTNRS